MFKMLSKEMMMIMLKILVIMLTMLMKEMMVM